MMTHNTQNDSQATALDLTDLAEVRGGMGAWLAAFGPLIVVVVAERAKEIADKPKETAK